MIMGQSPDSEACNSDGVGFPFLQGCADFGNQNPAPTTFCERPAKVAPPGSILLSVRAPVGELNVATEAVGIGRGLCAIIPHAQNDARYFRYALIACSAALKSLGTGSTYDAVSTDDVKRLRLPMPCSDTQRAIGDFLDREMGRIDYLLQRQDQLERLARQYIETALWEAVTKGTRSTDTTRFAGLLWAHEIPGHWRIVKIKYVARLRSGHTPSRSEPDYWNENDCTIPWFTLADVWKIRDGGVEYVRETAENISPLGLANSSAVLLPKGTVIFSRTASVGHSAILDADMATSQDFMNWTCGPDLLPEYLLYVFRAMKPEFERLTMGSTHQTIYLPDVQQLKTPVPSPEEQREIVQIIRRKKQAAQKILASAREQKHLLREYRSALISAAVTGQLDIRRHEKHMEALG
ncbi:MAG: restriction endonuclease subunit S [Bryobacterales bacterium]|nr:restriction endonuclease subunit S [Bryobacterales bacterium]